MIKEIEPYCLDKEITNAPDNFTFYDSYIQDIKNGNLLKIKILFWIPFITNLAPILKDNGGFIIQAKTEENKIKVMIDRTIPKSLFEDLKKIEKSSLSFLIGYISEAIPIINETIITQKYITSQVIDRPINSLSINDLLLVNLVTNERVLLPWPIGFGDFPFLKNDPKQYNYIYVKDVLDSMTFFLFYEFDECIRKIITSFDNALIHYEVENHLRTKLNLKDKERLSFNKIVDEVIQRPELNYNFKIIYKLRNKIVHDQLRLDIRHENICKKAIGTLEYVYKGYLTESKEMSQYILQNELQFMSILEICRGMKIRDFIEDEAEEPNIINNPKEMDDAMFGSIKYTNQELTLIGLE